jgi:hypothetical protein
VYSLLDALLKKEKLVDTVKKGLARVRRVVTEGYVGPALDDEAWETVDDTNLPVEALNEASTTDIVMYTPPKPVWQTACDIVCGKDEVLRENTVLRLGNLVTSSPEYAQTLLRLTSRLKNHLNNDSKVLSFSIFGGPGSGKSFVAKQIAKAVDTGGSKFEYKTFNLSQFTDSSRLVHAFKEIQTIGLKGKVPFILWDEFDTSFKGERAGWLSSFLMPMQDAKFFDGLNDQALGKCIFVFIGGTFENDTKFSEWTVKKDGRKQKGTDFHSRLSSCLNVPSVDLALKTGEIYSGTDEAKLVRAVMIRAFLSSQGKIRSISQEVLAFLLHVPLQHGVRSLEKIISASELSKTTEYHMYHLPPLDVLQLHVNKSRPHSITKFMDSVSSEFCMEPPLELEWRKKA